MGGKNFLAGKSWHTGTIKNMAAVWEAEQKAAAEKKRIEELQKELQRERSRKEIMDAATRGSKGQERVDWMYQTPMSAQVSSEEYLTGKAVDTKEEDVAAATTLGLFQAKAANPTQEAWNKVMEDPLFAIQKREKESLDSIKSNPVKMKRIREKLLSLDKKGKHKKDRKRDKKERRERKERKRERRDRDRDERGHRQHRESDDKRTHREDGRSRESRRDSVSPRRDRRSPKRESRRDKERDSRSSRMRDSRSPRRRDSRSPRRRDSRSPRGRDSRSPTRRDSKSPSRRTSRSPMRGRADQSSRGRRDESTSPRRRYNSRSPTRESRSHRRRDSRSPARGRRDSRSPRREEGFTHRKEHYRTSERYDRDRDDSRGRGYGHSLGKRGRDEGNQSWKRQRTEEDSERRTGDQIRGRESSASAPGPAVPRGRRPGGRGGRRSALTEEEKRQRLAEMENDAEKKVEQRLAQIQTEKDEEDNEQAEYKARAYEKVDFIDSMNKKIYTESQEDLEDRLRRNKHFRQKGNLDVKAFL